MAYDLPPVRKMAGTHGEDALVAVIRSIRANVFEIDPPPIHFLPVGADVLAVRIDVDSGEIVPEPSAVFMDVPPARFASFPAYFRAVKQRLGQRSKTAFTPYERCNAILTGTQRCRCAPPPKHHPNTTNARASGSPNLLLAWRAWPNPPR